MMSDEEAGDGEILTDGEMKPLLLSVEKMVVVVVGWFSGLRRGVAIELHGRSALILVA